MRAVVYQGPRKIAVTNVPDAEIEEPTDVPVRITSTNICGSDLHMYEGRTIVEKGLRRTSTSTRAMMAGRKSFSIRTAGSNGK